MKTKEEIYKQIALTRLLFMTQSTNHNLTPTMEHIAINVLSIELSKFKTIDNLTVPLSALNKLIKENNLMAMINFDDAPADVTKTFMLMVDAIENKSLNIALKIYQDFINEHGYKMSEVEKYVDLYIELTDKFLKYLRSKYQTNTEIDFIEEYEDFIQKNIKQETK
jgi:hypothetical protein